MACELFTKAPKGTTLDELQQALQEKAETINSERKVAQLPGFASVYVTDVGRDPRDNSLSVMIQFSDHDEVAPEAVRQVLQDLTQLGCRRRGAECAEQNWFGERDPYLA